MRAYIDMVSSAAPSRGNEAAYTVSPIRIALAIEDDDKRIVRTLIRRIAPAAGARIDPAWCAGYGCPAESAGDALDPAVVAAEAAAAIAGIPDPIAHYEQFHRYQLVALLGTIDAAPALGAWFCTMHKTTDACRLPSYQGRGFKPPKFTEAVEHFTGEPLPSADGMTWQEIALRNLTGLRRIFWGFNRWGLAPEVAEVRA